MSDRLSQIVAGITAAGEGSFQLSLSPDGEWVAAAIYGRESRHSDMAGAASYGVGTDPDMAVSQILSETRWSDL